MIVNPAAGRGRAASKLPEIRSAFSEVGVADIFVTAAGGAERDMASVAIGSGFTTIVAVGGDGTSSNIANSILRAGSDTRLAVVPAGTGNDFAKTLSTVSTSIRETARLSIERSETRVDVGRVEDTYFLNSCGFGFDVAVIGGVARFRWLRGRAVYLVTALRELFSYRGLDIALDADASCRHMMLVIANTPHFGGTFTIAPGASAADGELDAVAIIDVPTRRRIALLAAAMRGTHGRFREVVRHRAAGFTLEFLEPPLYQTDGELRHAGSARLRVECVPAALRVLPGASAS